MTEMPATVGRYHVERLIAHGGMGSLYLARDPAIDRLVAIKLLKEGFDDTASRERFAREARAAGRLHHPNVVTVFDVGEHGDRPFIAMEYVPGETLHQFIQRRAVCRMSQKLALLEDLCAGLHYAHCAGIVHRDIKPANVMHDQSGLLKILDFGIARAGVTGITRAGDVVGTLNYMSPEQLVGEHVDHRTDVYSVGVLAYELITSHMAFPGTIQTGVLHKILHSSPVPMESLVPGIDPDIPTMIERAMAREIDARYQDLEGLRQDLSAVRTRLIETEPKIDDITDPQAETRVDSGRVAPGTHPRPSSRASSALRHGARAVASLSSTQVNPPPHRTKPIVLLAVACAALAVALVATLMFNRPASSPVQTDSTSQQPAPPPAPAPAPTVPQNAVVSPPERASSAVLEQQLSAARESARQQIVARQPQSALDTLVRGLALDANDRDLNGLLDELARVARQTATEARAAASRRGATPASFADFRQGQAREREADSLLRAGGRVPGIQAFWAAAALYNKALEVAGQRASAPPPQALPTRSTVDGVEPSSSKRDREAVSTVAAPESPQATPAPVNTPSSAALPPPPPLAEPKPESPPPVRDTARDPNAADPSAIRETLRRYMQAYQSLNSGAVGRMMPSLTAEQLRSLGRDFSNYRSYTVDIRDERIAVDGLTATVTCQVVRSFETKTGVAGSNTVQSIFHLRRNELGWTIERLESR